MIGLPLKWSTEATVAFSLRSRLEVDFNSDKFEFHAEAICRPSATVTVLSQKVMYFESVTQIGILSNFSGHSSVPVKAKLNYTEKRKVFSFEKPSKTQKILEFFHTNQFLKSYTPQDADDWDTGVSSSLSFSFVSRNHMRSIPNQSRRLQVFPILSTSNAFASFYYDLRNEQIKELSEKEIKDFNLTISRNSWAVEVQKEKTGGTRFCGKL
ncbi:apolipoprotein B-100 [Trichonephila clavata]|uniref:Apolipoprotein B-100 n=1 Tax=Trichonephila clavata TaxID=2740835 RepID=A0A8X6IU42_TRICU|nr:apolipoprotein B-100 [Trichonephila clavata]